MRLKVWLPLLFALVMILGMVLGFNLRDSLRNKRDIFTIIERNDRLEQLIDLINERYVDTITTNVLYRDAVNGILSHLDPHTVYITPDELQAVNEDMEGRFYGIGVEFSILDDTVRITSVLPGGPAYQAGVHNGTSIIYVNDSLIAGNGITSESIVNLLRGPLNSTVKVTLMDQATSELQHAEIKRGEIPIVSIDAAFMLDNTTGYIRINRFSATTYEEFSKAIQKLKDDGAKQLVLDLRQNPGGYLDAATKIADDFLDGDKVITYTEGRKSAKKTYTSGETGKFEKGKLAILVDENSASASEIIAGAIQDWDRGVIVGRRTYGKGLVQEQYELGDGSALRLTIARYFTPSGRSIQRSYAAGKEAYRDEFNRRYESGELTSYHSDTSYIPEDTVKYYTSKKRVVYGGGGIMPDIFVPYDTTGKPLSLYAFLTSRELDKALWTYFALHKSELSAYKDVTSFQQQFHTDSLLKHISKLLSDSTSKQVQPLLHQTKARSYVTKQLKARLARMLFRNDGYYSILAEKDQDIQKAIEALKTENSLSAIRR